METYECEGCKKMVEESNLHPEYEEYLCWDCGQERGEYAESLAQDQNVDLYEYQQETK